jgi:N-formylglutamate amidohydrolase
MIHPAYSINLPRVRSTSVLFDSPHSGQDYPPAFLRRAALDQTAIRSSEDAFVDLLFASAPEAGAPLLCARTPRAYVDLNRSAEELDPALIEGVRHQPHNPRVASGLGVIPRVVSNGRTIMRGKLALPEARARLAGHWRPYHDALDALIAEQIALFGEAILIDCHSMPHEAIEGHFSGYGPRPDVILGDRFGASASAPIMDRVEAAFVRAGLRVARNAPFAGAYITQHYGRPSRRQHVIQVEIDRALYMNERSISPNEGFNALRETLADVIEEIAAIGRQDMPLAAE